MDEWVQWFKSLYNIKGWIGSVGYPVLFLIVFAETGLLVGFFLPGDSLMFTAGLVCNPNNTLYVPQFDIITMNIVLILAAIIGDTVGYWIGSRAGRKLYERDNTLFFRKDHLLHTKEFYEKHGGKTIIIARFVPLIRTFAPVVAGIAQMPYREFVLYNIFGGIGWVTGLTVLGYFLGGIPWIGKNLEITIWTIIFISLLPVIITVAKAKFGKKPALKDTVASEERSIR